jgi:hypothetical protein
LPFQVATCPDNDSVQRLGGPTDQKGRERTGKYGAVGRGRCNFPRGPRRGGLRDEWQDETIGHVRRQSRRRRSETFPERCHIRWLSRRSSHSIPRVMARFRNAERGGSARGDGPDSMTRDPWDSRIDGVRRVPFKPRAGVDLTKARRHVSRAPEGIGGLMHRGRPWRAIPADDRATSGR